MSDAEIGATPSDETPPPRKRSRGDDPFVRAATFVKDLEAAMKANKLWPGDKPAGEIEVKGAFGSENMAFTQWLAWVLIPRVNDIVETRDSFPSESQVAAYAVREFDGVWEANEVIALLEKFDRMVSQL